jgi:hypothetical protein
MPLPPEQELVWIAGFLEGQGFSVLMKKGYYLNVVVSLRNARIHHLDRLTSFFDKFSNRAAQKTRVYQTHNSLSLGERFLHSGRPAVYSDQYSMRRVIHIYGDHAKAVMDAILPFLSAEGQAMLAAKMRNWRPVKKKHATDEQVRLIRELYGQGMRPTKIAPIVGLHHDTVRRYARNNPRNQRRREEVAHG